MTTTYEPLYDLDAEKAVLGACMEAPAIVDDVRKTLTDPVAFYRPQHRVIYRALLALSDAGNATDPINVTDYLRRTDELRQIPDPTYVFEVFEHGRFIANYPEHVEIVARHAATNRATATLVRALDQLRRPGSADDVQGALSFVRDDIDKALGDITATTSAANPVVSLYQPLDWQIAFASKPAEVPWLVENLIEAGRSIAIYSPPKTGKSLLTLEIAAALAAGRPVLGQAAKPPMKVVYVDIENTIDDVTERLANLGYGPEDLSNLVYYSFPSLPVLDSAAGGQHLMALVKYHEAVLVVIDTVSRVIEGSENDADTFSNLYRHALAPLKGMGVAVIRLDHSGKDLEKGQRGSSAKGADVDAVWLMVKISETALYLKREMSRANHGVPLIELRRRAYPLRHELATGGLPPRVQQVVDVLEELGVPKEAGRDAVREELHGAGIKASNETISAAIAARKAGL
ncbi:AAA family ATPase [Herbidospora daliensis]|uniref:AAA family ATPase n=1 Tax=Herbidospora daliensis TaxID=295585 RepID=UPI00078275FF|nr:AAA family ATPase [Herbidospora daliensis]